MQLKQESLGEFSELDCDTYSPQQLKEYSKNPKLSAAVNRYLQQIISSYLTDTKTMDQMKRDVALCVVFDAQTWLKTLLNLNPDLLDVVLVHQAASITNGRADFNAYFSFKLPHLIALWGSVKTYKAARDFLKQIGKNTDEIRDYFNQSLHWFKMVQGEIMVRGIYGPTPLFISILSLMPNLTRALLCDKQVLISHNEFDIAILNTINPYDIVLRDNAFKMSDKPSHMFAYMRYTVNSKQTRTFLQKSFQHALTEALAGNNLLLERFINVDSYHRHDFIDLIVEEDKGGVSPLMRITREGNFDVLTILTRYLSRMNYEGSEFKEAVNLAKKEPGKYLLIVKHFLVCHFLSNEQRIGINNLLDDGIFSSFLGSTDKSSMPLNNAIKVAELVQNAIVRAVPVCQKNGTVFLANQELDSMVALQKAAEMDNEFFNWLMASHLSSNKGRWNHYLYAPTLQEEEKYIKAYLDLLYSFYQKFPQHLKFETLTLVAEELNFYVSIKECGHMQERRDFTKGFLTMILERTQLAARLYSMTWSLAEALDKEAQDNSNDFSCVEAAVKK